MKVVVVGATGSIGRLAVEKMLSAGHTVTALARSPERLGIRHADLMLAQGDVLDPQAIQNAIRNHDAVVVTLGSKSLFAKIRSQGTLNVIRAMQAEGVDRLICQSTLGAHESWTNLNFFWKRIMFGGILRAVFQDHELQEMLVRASGLDWTIVRPSAFTNGPTTRSFNVGFSPNLRGLSLKIARVDLAGFLTTQLGDATYRHKAVGISA